MDISDFDPNGVGLDNGNYFGLPFTAEESRLVLLSVPWNATASYGGGAQFGPDAIIGASTQLDLYDPLHPNGWREGIGTVGIAYGIQEKSILMREEALKVMKHYEAGETAASETILRRVKRVNAASDEVNEYVYETAQKWLDRGKLVGIVGGDHSSPYGLIKALGQRGGSISILQIDAHPDLRPAYQGFNHSHASIMYNAVTSLEGVERLVSVGIRDMCDAEAEFARNNPKIDMFTDYALAEAEFRGATWDAQCDQIVSKLGQRVYISFDIDGLSPENSPHTGTPVPGGLSFNKAVFLMAKVVESGRRIVGFDLCEVAPSQLGEWDANVGARVLYKMCNLCLLSSKK